MIMREIFYQIMSKLRFTKYLLLRFGWKFWYGV